MQIPDAAWVRERSNIIFAEYGYPEPEGAAPDRLQQVLDESVPELYCYLGIDLGDLDDSDGRVPLIRRALRMLCEFNAGVSQMELLESVTDFDLIQSFSASNYNESRRSPMQARAGAHPWPALDRLLGQILDWDLAGLAGRAGRSPGVSVPAPLPRPGERIMADTMQDGPSARPWITGRV